MNVVFATAEVSPIAKTGGLGEVCGSLPRALAKLGHEVTLFMPFYRQARHWFERTGTPVHQLTPTVTISWAGWSAEATFLRATLPGTEIPLILVANDFFFERDAIYERAPDGIDDFLFRYTFFNRAVIHGCELLGIEPDILHCHDWHTALLPVYLHSGLRGSRVFERTRSVYTIHNLNYQGVAARDAFAITGLHERYWRPDALEHFGDINPMKGGIAFADQVTTVSPNYAREIQTPAGGAGLDGVIRANSRKLSGILNGIDVEEWDPATDPLLAANFDGDTLRDRAKNKRALAREAGLKFSAKTPILAVISRLVDQKGFHLLVPVVDRLLAAGAQLVVMGSGDPDLEREFERAGERHPESCRVWIGFDGDLAHRIYAGADILLMPSMYEPCGLNQMFALRYGTVPVVRLTGGLSDSVVPYDGANLDSATGFAFADPTSDALALAAWVSILTFRDSATWKSIQANGMAADFSWERSAGEYERVYLAAGANR